MGKMSPPLHFILPSLFYCLWVSPSFGGPHIIMEELWQSIHRDYPFEREFSSTLEEEFKRRGKNLVQKQLEANRAKLMRGRGLEAPTEGQVLSAEEIVKLELEKNKLKVQDMHSKDSAKNRWKSAKKEFKKFMPSFKKALAEIPIENPVSILEISKSIRQEIKKHYFSIPNAFDIPIKNQEKRPTCSAFAGIRATEILLAQEGLVEDLSEQYFYWASKADCQKVKCDIKGSWVRSGFQFSKNSPKKNVPSEKNCPYSPKSIPKNETQLPLLKSCMRGELKIEKFLEVQNLDQGLSAIKKGFPVIIGLKLSNNYFENKGYVIQKDASSKKIKSIHSKGHAMVMVGFIKLPQSLSQTEGKICFIVANSWGEGWGIGGYSCLSETWIQNHRNRNPLVILKNIKSS